MSSHTGQGARRHPVPRTQAQTLRHTKHTITPPAETRPHRQRLPTTHTGSDARLCSHPGPCRSGLTDRHACSGLGAQHGHTEGPISATLPVPPPLPPSPWQHPPACALPWSFPWRPRCQLSLGERREDMLSRGRQPGVRASRGQGSGGHWSPAGGERNTGRKTGHNPRGFVY